MKISVVIPAYNGAKYIEQCLKSIFQQNRQADQIAIVIDKSSDDTEKICLKYKDKVEIFYNENPTGFVDAWNRAISKAKHEWICLLHQDDLIDDDFLEIAESACLNNPNLKYIYGLCDYIDKDNNILKCPKHNGDIILQRGNEYINSYFENDANRCPGVIAHRDVFTKCPFRNEPGLVADNDFFWRVGASFDAIRIDRKIASFRHHKESATHTFKNINADMFEEYLWIYNDYKKNATLQNNPYAQQKLIELIYNQGGRAITHFILGNFKNEACKIRKRLIKFHKEIKMSSQLSIKLRIYLSKIPLGLLYIAIKTIQKKSI